MALAIRFLLPLAEPYLLTGNPLALKGATLAGVILAGAAVHLGMARAFGILDFSALRPPREG